MENKTFFEAEERDYRAEILAIIRGDYSEEQLKEKLEEYHDNDIAGILEDELTAEERERILQAIGNEAMSEIVPFMEDAGEYLSELEAHEAADIIEHMDADDALVALDELDEKTRNEVLEHIEDEEVKEEIELLDSYDEDEFGSKMSTNFIVIKRGLSVKGAMKTMVAEAAENDNIYTIFVENEDGTFYGAIGLKELIIARSTVDLEELICTTFPYVCDKEIISENIERVRGYSEDLIPVLSSENGKLLGVITSKDIIDIVDEELGDDYAKLAALGSEEEHDESLLQSMKKRVPWLVALLFMGLAVSAVVGMFEGVVDELPMIVAFQSLILGMAGNVGTQSLAVTVRTLGTDEESDGKKQFGIILKETRVALCNGFAIGIVSFLIVAVYLCLFGHYGISFALPTAGCVGMAMCFAMMISGFTGAAIPIGLYRFGADPAVASGPLITTVNDLVAVISYYGLAWALLLHFSI
ncbi:MAG: magnesium transporter [Ruminococcaceae bacterium]|nr:magnesium transporter [Oscillospiraceae bacterium]